MWKSTFSVPIKLQSTGIHSTHVAEGWAGEESWIIFPRAQVVGLSSDFFRLKMERFLYLRHIFTFSLVHFLKVKVAQSCPTLCNPMDYTVHGILQARILEWVAFPFSRGSSQPSDWTQVSCIAGEFFTSWATKEDLKPLYFRHLLIEKRQKPVSLLPLMLISFFCPNSHIVSLSTLPWASQVALVVKNPPANAEDVSGVGSIPGSERSSRGGNNNPL